MIDLLGDLRRRKLGKLFDIVDTDDDGAVNVTDYKALGQRLAEHAGTHMNETQVDELRETFKQIWDEFQSGADKDGDGKINKEEFINSLLTPRCRIPPSSFATSASPATSFSVWPTPTGTVASANKST